MMISDETKERAAKAAHEANAVYCASHSDNSKPRWDDLPEDHWMKISGRDMVDGLISGAAESGAAQHEKWMKHKIETGWTYGPVKDDKAKTHPCLVPFSDLPRHEQLKDALAVRVACAVLGLPAPF